MPPEPGTVGATQGFDPVWQTWPTFTFPFATPFTLHVTVVSDAFVTCGVNVVRWFTASVADGGETLTLIALVTVTVAAAVASVDGSIA
jgi:hypothetical protein